MMESDGLNRCTSLVSATKNEKSEGGDNITVMVFWVIEVVMRGFG